MNPRQKFLERALSVGLDCAMLSPVDVIRHCTCDVLANHLPKELKAKLLQACLDAKTMNEALIVQVLGTEKLAENIPMGVVWNCIAEAAGRAIGDASAAKPTNASKSTAAKNSDAKEKKPAAAKNDKPKSGGKDKKPAAAGANRTKIPGSEFDVDTDVGEEIGGDWDDDIVEVVEEDVIGASSSVLDEIASSGGVSDWSKDEETVTRDVTKR